MSQKGAFSFRAATAKEAKSMASPEHDKREKVYMERMRNSELASERSVVEDIRDDLSANNIYYELNPGKSLEYYRQEAEDRYRIAIGQKPQKKSVFIRPVVMSVNGDVTIEKIMKVAEKVKELTGMTMLAAYYHADEGHYSISAHGKKFWVPNHHIHSYFLSQHLDDFKYEYSCVDKKGEQKNVVEIIKAGRTCRNLPYSKLQDELAPIFGMERGDIRNNDPMAFLDPTIKFARKRSYQAAQLIKAEARKREQMEEHKLAEAKIQEDINAKRAEEERLDKAIEVKQKKLNELTQEETSRLAENPSPLQVRRFLQENRDAIFNEVANLLPESYPGQLEGMELRENGSGSKFEELEMRDYENVYHLQVFLKTGNVYLVTKNGTRTKRQPNFALAEYLKANITPEMRAFLEESFPVTEELKEKKKVAKQAGMSVG